MLEKCNPEKVNILFLEGSWYKYLNMVVEISTTTFGCNAKERIEPWFNIEETIRQVAFIENLFFPHYIKEDFDIIFGKFLAELKKGEEVSISKWQTDTGGHSIIVANDEYFAISPIAILLGIYLDHSLETILKPGIERMKIQYAEDFALSQQTRFLSLQPEKIQLICMQYAALIRDFYGAFNAKPNYLYQRSASYFAQCDSLVLKYLM